MMLESIALSAVLVAMPPQQAVWQGVPNWIKDLAVCIHNHESINAGHYRAENPTSTASGAYQMVIKFWQGNARWVPIAKPWAKKEAKDAPPHVQDAVFIHSILNGGIKAWRGTGCEGTE